MGFPVKGSTGIERVFPRVDIGYFAYQLRIANRGQSTNLKAGHSITATNVDSVKYTYERKISKDIKQAISPKFTGVKWNELIKAIKERSLSKFALAFNFGTEVTLKGKTGWKFLGGDLHWEAGTELALLPIIIKGMLVFKKPITVKYDVRVNIGLSPAGWKRVAQTVGTETLKRFLATNGCRLTLHALLTGGVFAGIAAAAFAISFGLFSLTALYAGHVGKRGEITGYSTWYASAYRDTLYQRLNAIKNLKNEPFHLDKALRNRLIDAGHRDVMKDAQLFVRNNNIKLINPVSKTEMLKIYSKAIDEKYKNSKRKFYEDLMKRAKIILRK